MKRKLLLSAVALLCAVGMWADTDYTSKVNNAQAGWTGATGTYSNAKAPDQTVLNIAEKYWGDAISGAGVPIFSQTVRELDNGVYTVVFYATANNARYTGAGGIQADASDLVYVYAGSDKVHKTYVTSHKADSYTYPGEYIVSGAVVTDGTLELGMYAEKTGTQWQTIQVKALIRTDEASSVNGVDLTKAIINPTIYNASEKTTAPYGWTFFERTAGNDNRTGGTGDTFLELWSNNAMNVDVYQQISNLSKGAYKVTAYCHDRNGTGQYNVYGYNPEDESRAIGAINVTGDDNYADITTNYLYITNGKINLGLKGSSSASNNSWITADNFRLTYYGNAVEVYSPTPFASNTSATADKWYDFTVESAGYYRISSSAAATIYYTQDHSEDADNTASKAFTEGGYAFMNLSAGTFYFKSSATSTIKIEAVGSGVLQNGDVVTDVFITNPGFETGDNTGWSVTNCSLVVRNTDNEFKDEKIGSYYGFIQANRTNRDAHQTLSSVPEGKYVLSAKALANSDAGSATLNLGANYTNIPVGAAASVYYVALDVENVSDVEIKVAATGGDGDTRKVFFDNFTLTYYSTLPDVSITSLTSEPMAGDVRAALDAANTAYTSSKTVANYNALQTAIINAKVSIAEFAANTGTDADWTGVIVNPTFSGTYTNGASGTTQGWTITGTSGNRQFNAGAAESWSNNNVVFAQVIKSLPAGTYKLTAQVDNCHEDANVALYATCNETTYSTAAPYRACTTNYATTSSDLAADESLCLTTLYLKVEAGKDLTIGVKDESTSGGWMIFDNFKLTYDPTLPESVTAVVGKMNGSVESTQTSAVNTYNTTNNIDNLVAAQAAIYAATKSKVVYNEITTIKSNYDTKAAALDATGQAAYAVGTSATKYTNGTYVTASEAETAYHDDYIAAVKAQGDNSDMTDVIVNPSFEADGYTGWTPNSNKGGSHTPKIVNGGLGTNGGSKNFDYWVQNAGSATVTQTISSMPAGHYRLTVWYQTNNGTKFTLKANNTGEEETANGEVTMATTDFTLASAGNIAIEVKFTANWIAIDNFRLTYYDSAVYPNRTTIINNGGDITSLINGEFETNLDGWTGGSHVTGLARSWRSGSDVNNFMERTADGDMTCTLNNMPAGTYKVVAASRAAAGCKITPQIAGTSGVTLTGVGDTQSAASEINMNGVQMPYNNLGGFTTNDWGHNWQWITATGTLSSPGDLVINFHCDQTGKTTDYKWMPIDDVHLYCTNLGGTAYTESLGTISGNTSVDNTGNSSVVTCDIVMSNPNAIISSSAAINGAAGTQINNNLVSGTIANMVLYDGSAYASPAGEYAITSATYYRNIVEDAKATLMLPFALDETSKDKGTAYAPTRYANENVSFETVASPAADVPYVFVPSGDITSLTGARASASEGSKQVDGTSVTLYGTYAPTAVTKDVNNYVASAGMLWLVDSDDFYSAPFRAYLHIDDPYAVKSLHMAFDDDPTTVNAVKTIKNEGSVIYNLAGQRLNKMQKGINIINGKKVLVK